MARLGIQTVLPENFTTSDEFARLLDFMANNGLKIIELNIAKPQEADTVAIAKFLANYNITLIRFATGLTAKTEGLNLSAVDEVIRLKSVERVKQFAEFATRFGVGTGIILGFVKGGVSPNAQTARNQFSKSITELSLQLQATEGPVVVEATNFYETSVANTVADALGVVLPLGNQQFNVLPDTFHMNIMEADMQLTLEKAMDWYQIIHLSDNNRNLPGLGGFDFKSFFDLTRRLQFKGDYVIEGNIKSGWVDDLKISVQALRNAGLYWS